MFEKVKNTHLDYWLGTSPDGLPVGNVRGLMIHQEWDDDFIEIIKKENIEFLNYSYYAECNIDFLEKLQGLGIRDVDIQVPTVKDLRPLVYIKDSLECLSLDTSFTQSPDFSTFPNLWCVGLTWRTKAKSILQSKTITQFGLEKHPFETMEIFADMPQLESLFLSYGKLKSLKGIENLPNLRKLDIAFCRTLESLDGIQNAPKLTKEKTVVTKCKQITEDSPYAEYVTFNDLY